MRFIKIVIILFVFISNLAAAGVSPTPYFSIDKIRISDNTGYVYIKPTAPISKLNSTCEKADLLALSNNYDLFHLLYSAADSGKQIKVWLSTDADDCLGGYQKIRLIEVDF
ncbi:hypothetical protein [Pseudoalteromonas prydzensis]|uniref:hypothetical protein n=1 Tax=Pseudoalteromonas prydzensis TaxID=182141 RepID=UPI0012F8FE62|nr:hypothetical protein [Pseudoalteromonas prydzensis]MBE0380413.1 hypothetical protein [Pseudoalteromonas prydzensis ACAM 620]